VSLTMDTTHSGFPSSCPESAMGEPPGPPLVGARCLVLLKGQIKGWKLTGESILTAATAEDAPQSHLKVSSS
jgi:hypothetical protein